MFAFIKHLVTSQNQFASGGLLLMMVGGVGVFLRELPMQAWAALVRQTTLMITIKDDDAAFQWVKEWFLEQSFLERVRRVDLDTTLRGTETALIPRAWQPSFLVPRPALPRPFSAERTDQGQGATPSRIAHLSNARSRSGLPAPLRRRDSRLPSSQARDRICALYLRRLLESGAGVFAADA